MIVQGTLKKSLRFRAFKMGQRFIIKRTARVVLVVTTVFVVYQLYNVSLHALQEEGGINHIVLGNVDRKQKDARLVNELSETLDKRSHTKEYYSVMTNNSTTKSGISILYSEAAVTDMIN